MEADRKPFQLNILVFSIAAAVAAAVAGIAAYIYSVRRFAGDPKEILGRCRHAIDNIEKSLAQN
ncbi:MAG TPA: hypothetical protein VGK19_14575 [Capsulimonadaceae bacterium]